MSYVDPVLFENLHRIEKEQLGNKSYSKWDNYQIKIQGDILEKLKSFNPINE